MGQFLYNNRIIHGCLKYEIYSRVDKDISLRIISHATIISDSALWFNAIFAGNRATFCIINRIIHGCLEI